MGKRLIIIRHAKSDWKNTDWTSDFDRPLNKRGHEAAEKMAQRIAEKRIQPDLVVSSPAVRAFTTAQYFAKAWKIKTDDLVVNHNIYEAGVVTLLGIVNQFDDQKNTIAIFGHNPGFTEFGNYLSNSYIANMPTASVVIVDFPFDHWAEISGNTGDIVLFDYPKNED